MKHFLENIWFKVGTVILGSYIRHMQRTHQWYNVDVDEVINTWLQKETILTEEQGGLPLQ